ncbi:MAG TPA: hydantoinase/oxoprolinase family protein [Streptosporangiaceae bacterium]|nr:hydantoinase/oxoprolinase family protein [Streptosporangiaceae bacterium]
MSTSPGRRQMILATDAGGTMTDAFAVREDGSFSIGKALTNKVDGAISYTAGYENAAERWGMTLEELHAQSVANIYAGTLYLNTLLEQKGRDVGLIVTKGQESMYIHERGHSWLGLEWEEVLHHKLHHHVGGDMFRLRAGLVKGVAERIASGGYFMLAEPGQIKVPLNEREVRIAVEGLLDEGVEVIGVVLLFSYLNGSHEARVREIAHEIMAERDVEVEVILSSEIVPVMKEVQRMKSVLMEAAGGPIVRGMLRKVESAANARGYEGELATMASYGSIVNIRHPRMYETILSGPTGGLIGAKDLGQLLGERNVLTADIGGTSFDVGMIQDHTISLRNEPDFAGHRLALQMVALDSIGAGAGSEVHVDPKFKHITLGPQSAGSDVGRCLSHPNVTVSDCNVALGFLDPDNFLGGDVKLDRQAAIDAVRAEIADPLGLSVEEAASGVLTVLNSYLNHHLLTMLKSRGATPSEWTMFMFGGAGPLHMYGVDVPFGKVYTFPFAAAFSAFGVACADYAKRFNQGTSYILPPGAGTDAKDSIAKAMAEVYEMLEAQGRTELHNEGRLVPREVLFGASMRYVGVLETLDVTFSFGAVKSAADIDRAIKEFEEQYTKIYGRGAALPESGFFLSELSVQVVADKLKPTFVQQELAGETPSSEAVKSERPVYFDGEWLTATTYDMDSLQAGNVVRGPAIIEHSMTTLVVPPKREAAFDEYRFIEFRDSTA